MAPQIMEVLGCLENVDHCFDNGTENEKRALCRTLFDKIEAQADATVSGGLYAPFVGACRLCTRLSSSDPDLREPQIRPR